MPERDISSLGMMGWGAGGVRKFFRRRRRRRRPPPKLLEKSKEPLKAYAILFDIQKKGIKFTFRQNRDFNRYIYHIIITTIGRY